MKIITKIIISVLLIGILYFAYLSAAYFFWKRAEKVCMYEVCELDEMPENKGYRYVYTYNGLCGCYQGSRNYNIKTVDPATGKISCVVFENGSCAS